TGEPDYNFAGEPDFGSSVDKALARLNKQFSTSISTLMESLGEDVDIETDARLRLRRTSGALATSFMASINGTDIKQAAQYGKDGEDLSGSIAQFFNDVMSKGVVKAINATRIDDAIKGLFSDLESVDSTSTMLTNVANLATYSDELNDVWGISIKQAAEVATLTSESTDALIANVAAIAQFSAAQRSAGETLSLTRTDLQDAFDALSNADFPKTLADYDAAMKAVDATVEGSIETFADLFTLRESFAQYQAAIDGIKAATSSAVFDLRTDAEKLRLRNADLASIAAAAGVSIPRSAADLVALADAIDYTSESGVNLALALPSLVAAFNAVDEASAAAGISATTAAAILERAFSLASDGVDSAFDALSRSVDAEKKRLDAAYAAQAASLSDAADAARTVRDNISALSDRLTRAVSSNAVDTVEFAAQRRLAAQQSLDTALAAAQSGQSLAPFSAAIETAIGDLAQPSEDLYETFVDYARAQGRAAGTLAQLDVQAKAQKSVADLTLDAINASIRAAEVQHTQDIAALDRTLENAQAQLDALNGIDGSVLAVADAIAALTSAIAAAGALNDASLKPDTVARVGGQRAMLSSNGALLVGDTVSATNGYTGSVADATSIITAVFGATAPADFKAAAKSVGLSAAMIDELYSFAPGTANLWAQSNGLKGFAHGGVASAGMYIAGEHGPELINASAATRIYPAEQTSALMDRLNSPANNANELLREIRELRKVIERQAEQLASIQSNTGTTAEILNSNTGGGGPSLVRMV
ncbi:MAG: hypothetical protein KA223_06495, partial [Candidatus Accumulibacter sp.]|nr:hypothetical protein [Accumulibacter sp.]